MLENMRREFGGAGWPGCGVVDIALVRGGQWQLITKKIDGRLMQESVKAIQLD
jgi:hypothetical protein